MKNSSRSLTLAALLLAGGLSSCSAEEAPAPGIAVGEAAPGFELKDQNGQPQSLAKFLEKGNTALVFYRSADW